MPFLLLQVPLHVPGLGANVLAMTRTENRQGVLLSSGEMAPAPGSVAPRSSLTQIN